MPSALSHVPLPNVILAAFILILAGWLLLAEFLPGRRRDDESGGQDEGDGGSGRDRDPEPPLLAATA